MRTTNKYLFKVVIASIIGFTSLSNIKVLADGIEIQSLSNQIEESLNSSKNPQFNFLDSKVKNQALYANHKNFLSIFPNAKWSIYPSQELKDGRRMLIVSINGTKQTKSHNYTLVARQKLAIDITKGKIGSNELMSEYSIFTSGAKALPVRLNIPDVVLTGSRYDVDIVLEKPLGNSVIAGGLININNDNVLNSSFPKIDLQPMGGGGIFKSVQAPLKPGSQRWAALLAHPDGLVAITKLVRIVNNKSEMGL